MLQINTIILVALPWTSLSFCPKKTNKIKSNDLFQQTQTKRIDPKNLQLSKIISEITIFSDHNTVSCRTDQWRDDLPSDNPNHRGLECPHQSIEPKDKN